MLIFVMLYSYVLYFLSFSFATHSEERDKTLSNYSHVFNTYCTSYALGILVIRFNFPNKLLMFIATLYSVFSTMNTPPPLRPPHYCRFQGPSGSQLPPSNVLLSNDLVEAILLVSDYGWEPVIHSFGLQSCYNAYNYG